LDFCQITALKKELKRKDAKIDLMEAELETQKQTINELEYTIKELNAAFQQQKS
jgi:peptidoglycan hydrolase CwlO-like protein